MDNGELLSVDLHKKYPFFKFDVYLIGGADIYKEPLYNVTVSNGAPTYSSLMSAAPPNSGMKQQLAFSIAAIIRKHCVVTFPDIKVRINFFKYHQNTMMIPEWEKFYALILLSS